MRIHINIDETTEEGKAVVRYWQGLPKRARSALIVEAIHRAITAEELSEAPKVKKIKATEEPPETAAKEPDQEPIANSEEISNLLKAGLDRF